MTTARTGIVDDPRYREHLTRPGHPECPRRCDAVMRGIETSVPDDVLRKISPRTADSKELHLCHDPAYIDGAREDIESGCDMLRTGDTDICSRSYDVARLAVGGVLNAVDAVMAGDISNAFCAVRPPGHHATRDRGMGFCIFNSVAIGARYAQRRHGIERVLIVDWDVHHGNGTEDIFLEDDSVFYFSTHQWPFYPGTGAADTTGRGRGKGFTLNCPMPSGACREEIVGAFRRKLLPAMRRFQPQFVMVSAGFDARKHELIGNCFLSDDDFAELTHIVMAVAEASAEGRVVSVLEGGYALAGLASSTAAHVNVLSAQR